MASELLSFIIPAHNEERWIAACIGSIGAAMENIAEPYEVIVVDDASTDATHEIAQRMGARTLRVELRNIAAVRNVGARAAGGDVVVDTQGATAGLSSSVALTRTPCISKPSHSVQPQGSGSSDTANELAVAPAAAAGDILFFIDADTQANAPAIRAALAALRAGASGGGCAPAFDDPMPRWARIIIWISVKIARRTRLVGGCFQFCTREAFNAIGGFNENLCAGEDITFCQAIKKIGRFAVPDPAVITSARKLKVVSAWQVIALLATIAVRGPRYESAWIIDILYGNRAQASKNPDEH